MRKIHKSIDFTSALASALVVFAIAAAALGQTNDQSISAPLPPEQASWINSAPLSLDSLAGKGAVIWFFEEQCPRCRAAWPDLMALAKKHENEPVAFIAVNSGTPRSFLKAYGKQLKIDWPIVVDFSRQLEQSAGVSEINLQNICQARVLTPDGKLLVARWDDLEGAVQLALQGAKWQIDPAEIPAVLHGAWRAVEFGNYSAAGPALKKALASSDPATAEAAKKLVDLVQPKIDAAVAQAKSAVDSGDKWSAYKVYSDVAQRFDGFTLPGDVAGQRRILATDAQVRSCIQASKDLDTVRKILAANETLSPAAARSVDTLLRQAAKEGTGTQLAKDADDLRARLENPQAQVNAQNPTPAAPQQMPAAVSQARHKPRRWLPQRQRPIISQHRVTPKAKPRSSGWPALMRNTAFRGQTVTRNSRKKRRHS